MALTLPPETEAELEAVAAQRGLPPEAALSQVLAEARGEFAETVAGLRHSMAEIKAGRWIALEDFEQDFAEQVRRRRDREAG